MFPCSQQNFPCIPLFPKGIIFDFGLPCFLNTTFVPLFPALFSSCSLVRNNFQAMFPCSPGEPSSLLWRWGGAGGWEPVSNGGGKSTGGGRRGGGRRDIQRGREPGEMGKIRKIGRERRELWGAGTGRARCGRREVQTPLFPPPQLESSRSRHFQNLHSERPTRITVNTQF